MNKHLRRGLLALGLLTLTGCGDSADTLMRSGVNYKCELTDRLMKVKNEEEARKFIDHDLKIYAEKIKILDDKWMKWIKDIEDPYRKKKYKVINIESKWEQGTDKWEEDALNAPGKEDDQIMSTRKAFGNYMRKLRR